LIPAQVYKNYDDYGLFQQESATMIIRIEHDTSLFERVRKVESISTGVILREHTRLTDDVADDITEAYTPSSSSQPAQTGLRGELSESEIPTRHAKEQP
jgi:hypothetical protein